MLIGTIVTQEHVIAKYGVPSAVKSHCATHCSLVLCGRLRRVLMLGVEAYRDPGNPSGSDWVRREDGPQAGSLEPRPSGCPRWAIRMAPPARKCTALALQAGSREPLMQLRSNCGGSPFMSLISDAGDVGGTIDQLDQTAARETGRLQHMLHGFVVGMRVNAYITVMLEHPRDALTCCMPDQPR